MRLDRLATTESYGGEAQTRRLVLCDLLARHMIDEHPEDQHEAVLEAIMYSIRTLVELIKEAREAA